MRKKTKNNNTKSFHIALHMQARSWQFADLKGCGDDPPEASSIRHRAFRHPWSIYICICIYTYTYTYIYIYIYILKPILKTMYSRHTPSYPSTLKMRSAKFFFSFCCCLHPPSGMHPCGFLIWFFNTAFP